MRPPAQSIAGHLALIVAIAAILAGAMAYPFFPGRYDQLSVPLSTMAQLVGVAGLALVPGALLWLAMPRRQFGLAVASTAVGTGAGLILALVAALSSGNLLGVLTLAGLTGALLGLLPRLRRLKDPDQRRLHPVPLYLLCLPLLALASQLALADSLTRWSRDRAMANAAELIARIEAYYDRHAQYPASLQAQYGDYDPNRVGIDRYHYMRRGGSYNLAFEQPRFLLDDIGTREWVVYNPRGEHRVYSHTSWLLLPSAAAEPIQGWYASGDAGRAHWKYFLFD